MMSKTEKLETFPSSEPPPEASLCPSPTGFRTAARSPSQGREAAKRTLDPGENCGILFGRWADGATVCFNKYNRPIDFLILPTTDAGEPKIFPKVEICPYCNSRELLKTDFNQTGVLVTDPEQFSYGMYGFQELTPYYAAVVQIDNGPCILTELSRNPHPINYSIGAKVEMVFRKIKREEVGNYLYGFKFKITEK